MLGLGTGLILPSLPLSGGNVTCRRDSINSNDLEHIQTGEGDGQYKLINKLCRPMLCVPVQRVG